MKQRGPGRVFLVIISVWGSLLLSGISAFYGTSLAHADGGAPNLAYVAGAGQGVDTLDIAQQRVAQQFVVAGQPDMLLLSPDGALLYVTQPLVGSVVVLAAKTGQLICRASLAGHPALLALSVDSAVLYVAGMNEQTIWALNAQTCAQERTFQAPEPIHWLVASLASATSATPSTQLWLAGKDAVSVLDDQGQTLANIPVAGEPEFLSLPGALTAYVATRQGSIIALDMLSYRVIATILTGGAFGSMDYDAVTGEIYVPDQRLRQIDVLTPVLANMAVFPHEPDAVLPVNGSPQAIAITNDGQLGFVALSNGQVAMFDIPGRSLIKTIAVGGRPHFIITGAYPPPNVPQPVPASIAWTTWMLGVGGAVVLVGSTGCMLWQRKRRKKRVPGPA